MEATTTAKRAQDAATFAEAFTLTAQAHPDRMAFKTRDGSLELTWGEVRTRANAVAGGLAKLGVKKGDCVALMFGNRPEFNICDLGVMTLGGTPFSIYQTYAPEQIQYVCSDSAARVGIVETAYLDSFLEARKELPDMEHLIVVGGDATEGTISLAELEAMDPDFDGDSARSEVHPDDILTLIYTSGTTGPPKGVQLSHHNLMCLVHGIEGIIPLPDSVNVVSWLPSAHIAERGANYYLPLTFGGTIHCCDDGRKVLEYLPDVRPEWFFAVPRIWEKLKAGLETMLAAQPEEAQAKAQAAIDAAIQKVRLEQAGEPVPEDLAAVVAKADEEMFIHLRKQLGLDRLLAVNVGAAPTPVEVLEFFHAIGIELAELWGMSETSGGATCNRPGAVKIGTVGPALPGVEIKLAEDGEVLVRGEQNMVGYRNQPEKTAETIDEDGWLHTGDIGEIDDDGYLKIVDRKKELIINAAGKNMSPANIEAAIKTSSPLIGQACAIGDARPYNTALIVLDADFAPGWASKQGIDDTSLEALADNEAVRAAVQEGIDEANGRLARVEQIKKFTIVKGDWLPGGEELTPTMKLKRKPIDQKYEAQISAMYS
jgi:long-subunit acyl-CoA synthetase (AMP-forming)